MEKKRREIKVRDITIGGSELVIIAGPCAMESQELVVQMATELEALTNQLNIPIILKNSFDKANRLSIDSERGVGFEEGLEILAYLKKEYKLPLLVDVHETSQVERLAMVVDILQIPAFLSRQTDLIVAAARAGLPLNIKKGQFLAPEDIRHSALKAESVGNEKVMLTERGTSFGYHNLIVDFRGLELMKGAGFPVVFDATHSLQRPGGKGSASGGDPEFIYPMAKAAIAVGIDALYMEVHPNPSEAISDKNTQLKVNKFKSIVKRLLKLHAFVKKEL